MTLLHQKKKNGIISSKLMCQFVITKQEIMLGNQFQYIYITNQYLTNYKKIIQTFIYYDFDVINTNYIYCHVGP